MPTPQQQRAKTTIGFWHMMRDVLVASVNKGQLPVAFLGFIAMIVVFRMPASDLSRLVFEVVAKLERGYLVGYVLAAIFGAGWFLHARRQRRIINSELDRVSNERNELQKTLGAKVKSSKK